jgi:general secretion pathway protein I
MRASSRNRGFTLVEIMISLAIFAVVSASLVRNASMTVHQNSMVQDRTLAWWVAENRLNELRFLPREDKNFPSIGTDRVSVRMAQRDWELRVQVTQTENVNMRRIEITVYKDDEPDAPLISLSSFIGKH